MPVSRTSERNSERDKATGAMRPSDQQRSNSEALAQTKFQSAGCVPPRCEASKRNKATERSDLATDGSAGCVPPRCEASERNKK